MYDSQELHRKRFCSITAATIASTATFYVRFESPKKSRNLIIKIPSAFSLPRKISLGSTLGKSFGGGKLIKVGSFKT